MKFPRGTSWHPSDRGNTRRQRTFIIVCLGVTLLLLAFLYLPSVRLGLVSDDFCLLSFENGLTLLVPLKHLHRYSPLGLVLINLIKALFGLNPLPYHIVAVVLHAINVCLVFLLGSRLTGHREIGALGALLFVAFRFNYEAFYWVSAAIFYEPMTALFLSACLAFLSSGSTGSTKSSSRRLTVGILVLFALAILFHESALALLPTLMVLDVVREKGPVVKGLFRTIVTRSSLYIPGVLIALLFIMIKLFFTAGLTVEPMPVSSRLTDLVLANYRVLSPTDVAIQPLTSMLKQSENLGGVLAGCLVVVGSLALFLTNRFVRYGQLLLVLQMNMLSFVLLSTIQARYLYLPGIFASLIVGTFLFDVLMAAPKWLDGFPSTFPARAKRILTFGTLLLAFIVPQYHYVNSRLDEWKRASTTAGTVITESVSIIQSLNPSPREILFVNLPDGIPGAPWSAYIFRLGYDYALRSALGPFGHKVKQIRLVRTIGAKWAPVWAPVLSWQELCSIPVEQPAVILSWDQELQHMVVYGPCN